MGINEYTKWPKLATAVNDAKSLKSVLLDRYCFNNKKIVEFYNEKATRTNIIGKLRYLAKRKEQAEIAKENKELAAMDAKIAAMKKRLGTSSERSNDNLKNMLAMVRQKKNQKGKLTALKRQKAKEAAKRQAEIVTSEFGKDIEL